MVRALSWLAAAVIMAIGLSAEAPMAATTTTTAVRNGMDLGQSTKSRTQQRMHKRANVMVTMKSTGNDILAKIKGQKFTSRGHRVAALKDGLEGFAKESQRGIHELLGKVSDSFARSKSFWITNQIYVQQATPDLVKQLEKVPGVLSVEYEMVFPASMPVLSTQSMSSSTSAAQWGVSKINAPDVWATGNTGQGVVIGSIDTGVRGTHEALASNYRQTYGWYDPETKSSAPYDSTGHGTHVMGIMAGQFGFGVAPGATWIACKGCRAQGCYGSDLLACFQFMLCPTTPSGGSKDCSKAPNIVNNSWGGGQGLTMFDGVINAWRAAGIIPVVAAGNTGPNCGTIASPGDSASVITVGATDINDVLASFSSKGPTVRGLRKPDVAAPGALILSSCWTDDSSYCFKSGSSMASPHVAGAIALYLSANPGTSYEKIKDLLQSRSVTTTLTTPTGFTCGNTQDRNFPNNQYGYGRIDIFNTLS
ncbi:subtilisin serine protease [Phytophthora sojae]|uniref:subtilisin n=1 Tax=Phytophthora sojae (strain P6497) TaxID=1094619 RepID=G4Z299_PHYSP|nr:subtilisin serine protease [Phytophthora sojae]EGZ19243.1 subtilisin serine protease [Phytophthora sojae]|eukprot:XP_009521960.1 subtilisin serine protease [Phytophthora sojae]